MCTQNSNKKKITNQFQGETWQIGIEKISVASTEFCVYLA